MIGKVLTRWRKAQRMTLRELGAKCGVAPSTLLRIERGQSPTLGVLARIEVVTGALRTPSTASASEIRARAIEDVAEAVAGVLAKMAMAERKKR